MATNFRLGGTDPDWGTDSGESKPPTPNSDFSSDFAHFILEVLENPKVLAKIPKIFFKTRDFWGDIPPEFRTGGDTSPASPPVAPPVGENRKLFCVCPISSSFGRILG